MTTKAHADATSIHQGAYVQSTDPGASSSGRRLWVDTSSGPPYQLKARNAANLAWENVCMVPASLILTDTANGHTYRITSTNGALVLVQVT